MRSATLSRFQHCLQQVLTSVHRCLKVDYARHLWRDFPSAVHCVNEVEMSETSFDAFVDRHHFDLSREALAMLGGSGLVALARCSRLPASPTGSNCEQML